MTNRRQFGLRYVPQSLSKRDKLLQQQMILRSRKLYKRKHKRFFTRKKVSSFHSKPSFHIKNAKNIYNINKITPSAALAKATKCSQHALSEIVRKGKGAYYSSGSRPNQTPYSWANARLASAITGAKAAKIDYDILARGCKPDSKALQLANKYK